MKKQMYLSVECGRNHYMYVEVELIHTLRERFPSVECTGGGMALDGKNIRDVDILINYSSVDKVISFLTDKGFKMVKS